MGNPLGSHSTIEFNLPQLLTRLATQLMKVLKWGRGTGKSTIIGAESIETVHQMPRSSNLLVGETYQQILTRTLPSTIASWERMGYIKDRDYFIGRKPPRNWKWPEPYEPPINYKHFIIWYTGAGYHLVSQDRPGSGRGLNCDSIIADEMQQLDKEKFETDVLATNRGNLKRYPHYHRHHSVLLAGTTPLTQKGKWVLALKEEALKYPDEIFFLAASAEENRHNLGDLWFRQMRQLLTPFMYSAEVENIDPPTIQDGFYPMLNDLVHYYADFDYDYYDSLEFDITQKAINCLGDKDLNAYEPLIISVDWGAAINCMTVSQEQGRVFRFLNCFYVKFPQILDHLFTEKFLKYYAPHRCKKVFFWYDRNGNSKVANSDKTFFEQAKDILEKAGWEVFGMTRGLDPPHQDKYILWNALLQEKDPRLPLIRFNKHNCKELIVSMENAPAKEGSKGIQKDKGAEKKKEIPREEATDLSDAADIPVFGLYYHLLNRQQQFIDVGFY